MYQRKLYSIVYSCTELYQKQLSYCIHLYCIVYSCILLYQVQYCRQSHSIISNAVVLYTVALYYIKCNYIVYCCIVLYQMQVFCYTHLYCIISNVVLLYTVVLYCIKCSCIVYCCAIVYCCTVLYQIQFYFCIRCSCIVLFRNSKFRFISWCLLQIAVHIRGSRSSTRFSIISQTQRIRRVEGSSRCSRICPKSIRPFRGRSRWRIKSLGVSSM